MKKKYTKPEIEIVEMESDSSILAESTRSFGPIKYTAPSEDDPNWKVDINW